MEPIKEISVAFTRKIPLFERTCPVCGTVFQGAKLAVYCSATCRKKRAWEANGKQYNANRKKPRQKAQQKPNANGD